MNFNSGVDRLVGCPVLSKWKDNKRWYSGTLVEVVDGFGLVKYDEAKLQQAYIPVHLIKASDRLPPVQERPDIGLVSADFNLEQFKEYAHSIVGRDKMLCVLDKSKLEFLQRATGCSVFSNCGGYRLLSHHRIDETHNSYLTNPALKSKRTSNDRFQRNQMKTAQDCVFYEEGGCVYVITTTSTIVFRSNWSTLKTCYMNYTSYASWRKKSGHENGTSQRLFKVMC